MNENARNILDLKGIFLELIWISFLTASQLTTTEAFPYRIVDAGTNFTLKCEKRVKGPLQWHYPSTYINPEHYVLSSVNFFVQSIHNIFFVLSLFYWKEKPLNQRSISTSVKNGTQVIGYLNVSQASYLDTGLFTCRDNTYLMIAQEFVFVQGSYRHVFLMNDEFENLYVSR